MEYEVPKHTDLQMGTIWSFQTPSAGGMPAILHTYGLHVFFFFFVFCNTCATTLAFAGHLVMVVDELKEYSRLSEIKLGGISENPDPRRHQRRPCVRKSVGVLMRRPARDSAD